MKILLVVLLGVCATSFVGCSRRRDELAAGSFDDMMRRHRDDKNHLPNDIPIADDIGVFATVSAQGFIDLGNEFFQDLGANGRRCVSCHVPTVGWTLTPPELAGRSGFDVDTAVLDRIYAALLVYVGAQGIADNGKSAAHVAAGAAVASAGPSPVTVAPSR